MTLLIEKKCHFHKNGHTLLEEKWPIWRNGVHFTNLHSGNIGIAMAVFRTKEMYIGKKLKAML